MSEPAIETALKTFFQSAHFAVAGASSDPSKFGHKIFAWYLQHSLPVTPLNPRANSITVPAKPIDHTYPTAASPAALAAPAETALSVVTPPKVTLALLREAKEAGVRAVWLQPGTYDETVLEAAYNAWPKGVIVGTEGEGRLQPGGGEGWCVLVDGERGLELAGREWKEARL
ncbi:NAD(P)-binding protein [Trichodelitschia bisporula]|uniref:NAD(P)-binding protein n=1 Tax=Trichodelitschia bisporula TaxID=703511 RepID=A0A6G1I5B0_9PEZI|nr:NAD(P)-binding protein [Trichodelitschia bisporula]